MASIKVKFRPSSVVGREGVIYYQIINEREVRQLITDYRVLPHEWDKKQSMVTACPDSDRYAYISGIREFINNDISRINRIICHLSAGGIPFTTENVIFEFRRFCHEYTLFNYFHTIIDKLKQNHQYRTSETYKATLNSFRKFRNGVDILIDAISPQLMEEYQAWLRNRGISPNTTSFYARVLRALYNRAVEYAHIPDRKPFKHVYTGIAKTEKRALPIKMIRRIKALDLSHSPRLDFARDMFLLSFYLRGMSFIDMAFLLKTDLKNGYITYRRHKTRQQLSILWTQEMQNIINKYPPDNSHYLFPIIGSELSNPRNTYRNVAYKINRNLKKIAGIIGISVPVTLYVARHSWASAANANGIPISVISQGMGHDSEATTRIYLASLETSVVDKANSLIMRSIR